MKRCPKCQSIYTDESLVYCLQDGSKLITLSDSASTDEVTLQVSGEALARPKPPPTEILKPEDIPTARIESTSPTREQQRARPTAIGQNQSPGISADAGATPSEPRSSATVIALSIVVAILLVTLGGLITWIVMRDKTQTEARTTQGNTGSPQDRTSPASMAAGQKEVQDVLNAWADSISQRNLDEHMKYYADVLEVYYTARNVSRDRVRADRATAFSKYTSMEMKLSNINIAVEPSGTRATATFDKTFNFRGGEKDFNGSGLNRFTFIKEGGAWRITGEQDLKTYYINK